MQNHPLDHDPLRSRLKHLVADLFHLGLADADSIGDDEALIGSTHGLDSLDALELAICVEEEFGVTIHSRAESVSAFASIASLADYIQAQRRAAPLVAPSPAPAFLLQPSH